MDGMGFIVTLHRSPSSYHWKHQPPTEEPATSGETPLSQRRCSQRGLCLATATWSEGKKQRGPPWLLRVECGDEILTSYLGSIILPL